MSRNTTHQVSNDERIVPIVAPLPPNSLENFLKIAWFADTIAIYLNRGEDRTILNASTISLLATGGQPELTVIWQEMVRLDRVPPTCMNIMGAQRDLRSMLILIIERVYPEVCQLGNPGGNMQVAIRTPYWEAPRPDFLHLLRSFVASPSHDFFNFYLKNWLPTRTRCFTTVDFLWRGMNAVSLFYEQVQRDQRDHPHLRRALEARPVQNRNVLAVRAAAPQTAITQGDQALENIENVPQQPQPARNKIPQLVGNPFDSSFLQNTLAQAVNDYMNTKGGNVPVPETLCNTLRTVYDFLKPRTKLEWLVMVSELVEEAATFV
ncbi:unnamed protein product [Caenorhabditis sp. 36 PRJEB53466]|nr:unnamed protein product [Caenorhabditis sp. 36 PRJEB53466]